MKWCSINSGNELMRREHIVWVGNVRISRVIKINLIVEKIVNFYFLFYCFNYINRSSVQ